MADDKAAEVTEAVEIEVKEVTKPEAETKDEKTPETPVTEPITNGSSTPESPKVESPATEEPAVASPDNRPEPKTQTEPENLPVNGLSLEEPKKETPEVAQNEDSKLVESTAETTETVPAPEIPVKTEESCDEKPVEISENDTDIKIIKVPETPTDVEISVLKPEPKVETVEKMQNEVITDHGNTEPNVEIVQKEFKEKMILDEVKEKPTIVEVNVPISEVKEVFGKALNETFTNEQVVCKNEETPETNGAPVVSVVPEIPESVPEPIVDTPDAIDDLPPPPPVDDYVSEKETDEKMTIGNELNEVPKIIANHISDTNEDTEMALNGNTETENLKNKTKDSLCNVLENECNGNIVEEAKDTIENLPSASDDVNAESEKVSTPDDSIPPSLSEANSLPAGAGEALMSNDASESFPPPPSELCQSESASPPATPDHADTLQATPDHADTLQATPDHADTLQDILPVSDKMADLIPEVPAVPELKTETETTTDVAVAN